MQCTKFYDCFQYTGGNSHDACQWVYGKEAAPTNWLVRNEAGGIDIITDENFKKHYATLEENEYDQ